MSVSRVPVAVKGELAVRFREFRKLHNISRAEYCRRLDLTPNTVLEWEMGTRVIGYVHLHALGVALGNDWLLYLMGLSPDQPEVIDAYTSNTYRSIYTIPE